MTMLLEAIEGDITDQRVDVIVNAANSSLLGGGGVDGAIHAAAGPQLLEACRKAKRSLPDGLLPVGQAIVTRAGNLHARWVVHTVGPNRHRGQTDPELLASCFRQSILCAADLSDDQGPVRTVAMPAVSAGVYGWDVNDVARIAVDTVSSMKETGSIETVRFVLFGAQAYRAFADALA